ncbi:TonB-dependent receptor [Flavobacteriaceae bacterium XHP0103]|uniref:outer membrane beta-barrel family protein n=1 Tax=Marixanthotalea marina TaxID=2844359 RepID=UPI002989DCFD|nr:outer membrane beta-barrel family protein [Marixanthotalea marina]MBU3822270.1 TonB-dependent receptor [Marixanthotalea marina]
MWYFYKAVWINYFKFVIDDLPMSIKSVAYFFFIFSLPLFSQEFTITGNIKDTNNTPIAFANIVILNESNAELMTGAISDDSGHFIIESLNSGNYVLKISFLGFKEFTTTFLLTANKDIGDIILEEDNQELESVVVVAKRPTVRRMVDRLIFNVENSTLSNGNALDVLKHSPGVFVTDGKITVKNSEPIVYINDRRVHLSSSDVMQLLEGTTATNIKSVEVITNPPAKYEAEGGAVINIVTSKNIIAGYNGSVFGNYKQGYKFPKYSIGTSHFFKTNKLNAYLNYNISPRKDFRHNDEYVNFFDSNGQSATSWDTDYDRVKKSSDQSINGTLEYDFNENNTLAFSTNILLSPRENTKFDVNSTTQVFDSNRILDSLFITDKISVTEALNFAYTLDYVHKFKREGERLSVSAHYTDYDYSDFQNVETGYFFPNAATPFRENRFQTFSSQDINLYTGQIDYELPINETSSFETGMKISSIDSRSVLNQYNFINGNRVEDLQNSDIFLYDEMNYAAYASYSKDWSKWSLQAGLRTEYTDVKGKSKTTNQVNNNNYIKFFPTFYILNHINENNDIYFNYKKRIYRPRYGELNPFKYYFNDNTYSTGNPNLSPQIDDVLTLGYTFNKNYTFELYYRFENNPTLEIVFQDNEDNIIKYINTNIDKSISYGLDFMTYTNLMPRWNLYALTSAFFYDNKFFALESNDELVSNSKWSLYAQINNYFGFLKDESLTFDVAFVYISPIAEDAKIASERWGLNLSLKKTFWKNRASLNIGVEDLLNKQNYYTTTKYLNQDVWFNSRMENRLLVVGFNYKFGNTILKPNSKNLELEELERLNKKESSF